VSDFQPITQEPQLAPPEAAPESPSASPLPPAANAAEEGAEKRAPREGVGWMTSLQSLAVTVVIAVFVITFLVQAFQIPSESMENTLLIGDYLLVDKVVYGNGGAAERLLPYRPVQRGDIIVFRYPVHPAQHFVKRVVGVPGDRIRLDGRQLRVNGQLVHEDYAVYSGLSARRDRFPSLEVPGSHIDAEWWDEMPQLVEDGELIVPAGNYFVLGDNRDQSLDSRFWGFVPRENIIGRPLLIYYSIGGPDHAAVASVGDGKLSYLVYRLTHLLSDTRWERTLRRVR
jgi:signal peptidase I